MTSDTIGGDKADGNVIKRNISVSAETGSAVSVGGGDAVVGTQIKDVAGNVIIQHHVSDKDAARNQRIRQHLLDQLQATWIQGVLENSLYEVARLELGLESHPEAVERPWVMSLERPNQPPQTLPPTSKILDTFKALNGAMLILGEPGSGKTITLLELARELRKVALADERQPVPLVFNLSSWAQERPPLLDWLVGELFLVYGVGRKQGPEWLKTLSYHLLLDGLDEVPPKYRDICVTAINEFQEEYGPVNMVVCSRTVDYNQLTTHLHLMGAVLIQPLTQLQIDTYLSFSDNRLPKLVTENIVLRELAQVPLTLNIIALAYRDRALDDLTIDTVNERSHLLMTYVNRMFERRRSIKEVDKQQLTHYLAWLASRMHEYTQSIYYIEKTQPAWFGGQSRLFSFLSGSIDILGAGLLFGLIFLLIFGLTTKTSIGLIFGLYFGLSVVLAGALKNGPSEIKLVEMLIWSWSRGIKGGIIGGLIFGVIFALIADLSSGIIGGLGGGFSIALANGLIGKELQIKSTPNQGILLSGRNALIGSLVGALIFGLSGGAIFNLIDEMNIGLIFGLAGGLSIALIYGGSAFIRHFLLRWFLARYNYLPFKLVPFLDEMAERLILRKVGGGYIFIHRMLLEYFADLEGKE